MSDKRENASHYLEKKRFFDSVLTVYGRKTCLEALADQRMNIYRLHLAQSNKPAKIIDELIALAKARSIEICYHDKSALSRISKNARQDQGVAADLLLPGFKDYQNYLDDGLAAGEHYLALDRITNPQNLGMIIRSVCASPLAGIILPRKGCAKLDSLVIKASAGTLFRTQILQCDSLKTCLTDFQNAGALVNGLAADAAGSLAELSPAKNRVFLLGNETDGVSQELLALCDTTVAIPMRNDVESLNVAVTAGIIAFSDVVAVDVNEP